MTEPTMKIDARFFSEIHMDRDGKTRELVPLERAEKWFNAMVEAQRERDEWKQNFEAANTREHEAIAADRLVERALGRAESTDYAEECRAELRKARDFIRGDMLPRFKDAMLAGISATLAKTTSPEIVRPQGGMDEALLEDIDRLREKIHVMAITLKRLRDWDMMDSASDGPYWRGEIAEALSYVPPEPANPVLAVGNPQQQATKGGCGKHQWMLCDHPECDRACRLVSSKPEALKAGDPCGCPTACNKSPYLRCALTGEVNPGTSQVRVEKEADRG